MTESAEIMRMLSDAIKADERSAKEISLAASKSPKLIARLAKGKLPDLHNLIGLCKALNLEFYVGSPRNGRSPALQRDGHSAHLDKPLGRQDKSVKIGNVGDIRDELATLGTVLSARIDSVRATLDALAVSAIDDGDQPPTARPVSVIEVLAAAGGGAMADDIEQTAGHAWFRREWLDSNAIDPTQSIIMRVKGESMEPLLADGASILVDRTRTRRRTGRIFAIRTADGLVAKRLSRGDSGGWLLVSDHPAFPPIEWQNDMVIIGEIRWTARTLKKGR